MNDFQDLSGSEFERADMSGSRFTTVLLNGATIQHSDMHQVTMRGVEIVDTTISGEIHNLVINGVDVAPLIIQTLRHLAFASESWAGRCILGDPSPWHPLSLPWDQMPATPGVPRDRDARPSLDEALALRHQAMALVRGVVDDLTDEQLAAETAPLVGPGWPPEGETFPVRQCLLIVLNEEWWHRQYAERDLSALEEGN
jgi:hypothetical protein